MADREFKLATFERTTLEEMRRNHPEPYLRERAAGLLRIAGGIEGDSVTEAGLPESRDLGRAGEWLRRYRLMGLAGLYARSG